jgi:hypothetical protein
LHPSAAKADVLEGTAEYTLNLLDRGNPPPRETISSALVPIRKPHSGLFEQLLSSARLVLLKQKN